MLFDGKLLTKLLSSLNASDENQLTSSTQYLTHFGYLPALPALDFSLGSILKWVEVIGKAIKLFQDLIGSTTTGTLTAETQSAMSWPRCGCPDYPTEAQDRMLQIVQEARWQNRSLKYYVRNYVNGISTSVQDGIMETVYRGWAQLGNIKVERVTSESAANLVIFASRIDGPGRILAQAQLPPGDDRQIWLQMDSGDQFVESNPSGGEILFQNVFWHETWHNGGLDHSRRKDQLMSPFYSQSISTPQSEDIQRWQSLYGPPIVIVPPPPVPVGTVEVDPANLKVRAPRNWTFETK